jgi:hypothetical protein
LFLPHRRMYKPMITKMDPSKLLIEIPFVKKNRGSIGYNSLVRY